jgi:nucleoside-diphosphate-sugar epimerase
MTTTQHHNEKPVLVIGGTGKTGRRVAERLSDRGVPVRIGSRNSTTPFDWEDPSTWDAALDGAGATYISYYPDLAAPAPQKQSKRSRPQHSTAACAD